MAARVDLDAIWGCRLRAMRQSSLLSRPLLPAATITMGGAAVIDKSKKRKR